MKKKNLSLSILRETVRTLTETSSAQAGRPAGTHYETICDPATCDTQTGAVA